MAEHKLTWVQHELLAIGNALNLGEVRLLYAWINEAVAIIAKDTERTVKMKVDRGRLHIHRIKWRNRDLACCDRGQDVAIRENAHASASTARMRRFPFPALFSVSSSSTSRFNVSRSSNDW